MKLTRTRHVTQIASNGSAEASSPSWCSAPEQELCLKAADLGPWDPCAGSAFHGSIVSTTYKGDIAFWKQEGCGVHFTCATQFQSIVAKLLIYSLFYRIQELRL